MSFDPQTGIASGVSPNIWLRAGQNTFSAYNLASSRLLNTTTYDAFGVLIKTGADTLLYYYRQGASHFGADGVLRRMVYTISTNTWGSPSTVYSHGSQGVSGVAGGVINGNVMLFFVLTNSAGDMQSIGSITSTDGLTGSTFATRVAWSAGDTRYEGYGKLIDCENGVYLQSWYSHNGSGTFKLYCRRTTDSGATWADVVMATSTEPQCAEHWFCYLGSGRVLSLSRDNNNGVLSQCISTDKGLTWSALAATNIGTATSLGNCSIDYDSTTGLIHVASFDRGSRNVTLCHADVDAVLASPLAWIAQVHVAQLTNSGSLSGGLGYPCIQMISTGSFYVIWNDEVSTSDADIYGGLLTVTEAADDATVQALFPVTGTVPMGFVQGTSGKRPTLLKDEISGQDAIRFAGASSQILVAVRQALAGTEGTAIILAKTGALSNYQGLLSSWDEAIGSAGLAMRANGTSATPQTMEIAEQGNRIRGSTTITADTLYAYVFSSSGAANGYDFRLGTSQETEVARSGTHTGNWFGDFSILDSVTIGGEKTTSESQFFTGDIVQVLVYSTNLSSADKDAITTWMLAAVASITITDPTGTSRRLVGVAEAIEWTTEYLSGTVDILLSLNGGGTFSTLAAGQADDGSYTWTPSIGQLSTEAVIRVRSTSDNALYYDSQPFSVATTTAGGGGSNTAERQFLRQIAESILAVTE